MFWGVYHSASFSPSSHGCGVSILLLVPTPAA